MIPDRRAYSLSPDQPILQRNRRRRRKAATHSPRSEIDFWKLFDVEKLCSFAVPGLHKRAGA